MLQAGNKILQNLRPDIERQCQKDLEILAHLTMKSNATDALDKAKNAVFSVLSYAVKEDVS